MLCADGTPLTSTYLPWTFHPRCWRSHVTSHMCELRWEQRAAYGGNAATPWLLVSASDANWQTMNWESSEWDEWQGLVRDGSAVALDAVWQSATRSPESVREHAEKLWAFQSKPGIDRWALREISASLIHFCPWGLLRVFASLHRASNKKNLQNEKKDTLKVRAPRAPSAFLQFHRSAHSCGSAGTGLYSVGGFQTAYQTLLWVMHAFSKSCVLQGDDVMPQRQLFQLWHHNHARGSGNNFKVIWYSVRAETVCFRSLFRSISFPCAATPPIFLKIGGLTHTLCWCSSHISALLLNLPRIAAEASSQNVKEAKKKKGCSSFISLTCSYFYKKAPHKIYIYSFAHVGASLSTTCPDDVPVNLALLLKVFAGCSTWKVLPLLRRKDIFMLNSCCKIHWMSLLLSKALFKTCHSINKMEESHSA